MKTVFSILCIFLFSSAIAQDLVDSRQREIVIRSVNVVPMEKEEVLPNQTVVIKDGKIAAIGSNVKYGKAALVIDGSGKYLIPGLAEMHAHVPPIDDLTPMKEVLFLFAANGITTIRGMLGHPKHLELRSMIKNGQVLGPRLFTTGPSFNGFAVKTPETGASMVRSQKQAGYDFLKLHPGLTKENFAAIASTAKEVGIPFVGHVSFGVGVWRAIDAGYSSIDHLDGFIEGMVPGIENMVEQQTGLFGMFVAHRADTTLIPKLMQGLKTKNIWVVPTQSLAERWFHPDFKAEDFTNDPESKYIKQETVNNWVEAKNNLVANPEYDPSKIKDYIALRRLLIKACQLYGVGLLLGCDAPQVFNVPGSSTHYELEYMVRSGLTPYEALRTGTVNVATYLKLPDTGMIKRGYTADLILIDGNPLQDITQTRKVHGVMLNGKWLS
ncbi:MAG TPA: amidohydrolase family protein, partial [Chryseolinea sp.]|nr:amidohydrolase family protein [Chryseolinea sp.]